MTAARRPVTVRERILRLIRFSSDEREMRYQAQQDRGGQHDLLLVASRLVHTTLAADLAAARRDSATANGRADQLERDKAQAQRERNAALDRAAIAERRLAAHCAEWAPRAAAAGLLNAPTHPGAALTDTTHAQPSGDIPS